MNSPASAPLVRVGQTSLHVSMVGFGTAPLASAPSWDAGSPIAESVAADTLQYAFDRGVRFFDTAPAYGLGLAETRTGDFLSQLPRDRFSIATKVGFDISDGSLKRDYSRDGVHRSLEASLKRLRLDHVDLLHVHDADHAAEQVLKETFPTLAEMRAQGVIKAIGAGMNQWEVPLHFARHADFDCFMIAGRYTLLEQGATPLLDYCADHHITVFAASIYNSGILATGTGTGSPRYNHAPAPDSVIKRVQALETACDEHKVLLHTAATQFPLRHRAVQALVVGFQQPHEVQACLSALQTPIPPAFWDALHPKVIFP